MRYSPRSQINCIFSLSACEILHAEAKEIDCAEAVNLECREAAS
jgi:hypothetical protein